MTRLKPLQDRLLLLLEDALHPRGFTRRQQTFVRRVPVGKHLFHVAFAPYPRHDYFDATADVAVRHDALEALLNANDPYLTEREKRWTASVGGELGNLSTGRRRRTRCAGTRWTASSAAASSSPGTRSRGAGGGPTAYVDRAAAASS